MKVGVILVIIYFTDFWILEKPNIEGLIIVSSGWLIGMRVNNIYDVDNKTYLIRLQRNDEKIVLLMESGIRIHTTIFEWPKNIAPSGFSMKLRKHLKNKRLESLKQIGTDRIIDLQFGSGEAAYHVILELYDKGNIVLTDHDFLILNVLRPHTEGDKVKFVVNEKYPKTRGRHNDVLTKEKLLEILQNAKATDQLKKVLLPHLEYGPALIEHVLLIQGFPNSCKMGTNFNIEQSMPKILDCINKADEIFQDARKSKYKGYIIQKREDRQTSIGTSEELYTYQEFHPIVFQQHSHLHFVEFESLNSAVDDFFSKMEGQKLEIKSLQKEREAMKKLENVRVDHNQRLEALEKTKELDKKKAEIITRNQELVDKAILSIQTLLANQTSWEDIAKLVKEAANKGDPAAEQIESLKLEMNHISLKLTDPYAEFDVDSDEGSFNPSVVVDIDLALTAFANARRYYDKKRFATKKQQKTIESHNKALKSAEKKTKQTLKEMQTISTINKARKIFWFEKFLWFISSENFLIIAGRDQQQNELIVKRYLKPTDIYVHADIHGAASVIIVNPGGQTIPPKTLNEAGTMAICYSIAWEAKVITNAYWVWGEQVSKTAPTGEYLQTGSFMIRGKKNFLPPSYLILGFSFLFRLEESFIQKHLGERSTIENAEEDVNAFVAEEDSGHDISSSLENDDKLTRDGNTNAGIIETIHSEESDEESENETNYPDTQIKFRHSTGTSVEVVIDSKPLQIIHDNNSHKDINADSQEPKATAKHKPKGKGRNASENASKNSPKEPRKEEVQLKRGQKSKLKKIKEKYKDQDEEERKLRMDILQSSTGSNKNMKKSKKTKETTAPLPPKAQKPEHILKPNVSQINDGIEDNALENDNLQADVDVINSLTGIPSPDDELLFAVPVIAPYNSLLNYKFKAKLTPGTGKRGKVARTAVSMFLKDRTITQRERDLLKAVKDEQLVRNFPGKVKLSTTKMQLLRNK